MNAQNDTAKLQFSKFLSSNPDDAGLRFRLCGDSFSILQTARPKEFDPDRIGTRERVKTFSVNSSGRMAKYLQSCDAEYTRMLTLTYPSFYPHDGAEAKEHLRQLLQWLKRRSKNPALFGTFWFLEFQGRGAPHFHIFLTDFVAFRAISLQWFKIVGSGDYKHYKAGVRVEKIRKGRAGTISYARKYARKQEQKVIPLDYQNNGRFWGITGLRTVVVATTTFYADYEQNHAKSAIKNTFYAHISELIRTKVLVLVFARDGFRYFQYTGSKNERRELQEYMNLVQTKLLERKMNPEDEMEAKVWGMLLPVVVPVTVLNEPTKGSEYRSRVRIGGDYCPQ